MVQSDSSPTDLPEQVVPSEQALPFFRALIENLETAVILCDAKGRILLLNEPMARICRADGSAGELRVGTDLHRVTSCLRNPDGSRVAQGELPLSRALRGERVRNLELNLGTDGRRPRTYRTHGQPVRDADGRLLGALLTLHDVTERRLAARFGGCELAVSEALTTGASPAQAGAGVLAAVGTRLSWPYGELWLTDSTDSTDGAHRGEPSLHAAARWVAPGHQPSDPLPDRLTRGVGLPGEVWATGTPRWYADVTTSGHQGLIATAARYGLRSAVAVPIRTSERFLGVLVFFGATAEEPDDALLALLGGVAAHVGQFLARRRADQLALELTRTRDDFLGLVGHELRTPLTSIVSHTELVLADEANIGGENRTLLESVDRNAHKLRRIVTDLLDLAGLESGDIPLDPEQVDLAELVIASASAQRPTAEANDVKIEVDAPRVLPVRGDPARLRQLVDQLLSNAVKYSPDGGDVRVRLERNGDRAELTISDAGIGIPEDERPRLFERFFRSSAGTARGLDGTGLGLPLARTIADRHGGAIHVRHGDPGTTLVVTLPVQGRSEPGL
jgi:signal transduction histidine kinase